MPKKTIYVSKHTQAMLDEVNKKLNLLKQLTNKSFPWHENLIKKSSTTFYINSGILSVLVSFDAILKEEGFETWADLQKAVASQEQSND